MNNSVDLNSHCFTFRKKLVRVIFDKHGNIWFMAKDVATLLGTKKKWVKMSNNDRSYANLKHSGFVPKFKIPGQTKFIDEDGLRQLVTTSKNLHAIKLWEFVFQQVLPKAEKTISSERITKNQSREMEESQTLTVEKQQRDLLEKQRREWVEYQRRDLFDKQQRELLEHKRHEELEKYRHELRRCELLEKHQRESLEQQRSELLEKLELLEHHQHELREKQQRELLDRQRHELLEKRQQELLEFR